MSAERSPSPPPASQDGGEGKPAPRRWLQRQHKNAIVYLATSLLSKAASLLLIPLYTKRLAPTDYAIYGLAQTFFWIIPTLSTLSLSAAFSRFYFDHRDPEQRARTMGEI